MLISKNVNNIVYPSKICHVNVNDKDSAAQCDICQSWVHVKYNKLHRIDYKSKAQISPGTICLVAVNIFLLKH